MNEEQAELLAKAFGGETWQSGGNIWLVFLERKDGSVAVLGDEAVCAYRSREAFHEGEKPVEQVRLI
jgi:hypothetical protein